MSILCKPVLIESAEQASTLPRDVLIYDADQGQVYVDAPPGHAYEGEFVDIDGGVTFADDLIGCTALVPIEVEEEWGVEMSESGTVTHVARAITREHADWMLSRQEPGTARIVHRIRATPWEEA